MDKFIAHILVVDDDDGIRTLVKKYLNENKFLVTTAENAENALEKIAFLKHPKLKKIKIFLEDSKTAAFVRMTGSGSVMVAYYHSKTHCELSKIQFKRKFKNYWCNTSKTI